MGIILGVYSKVFTRRIGLKIFWRDVFILNDR